VLLAGGCAERWSARANGSEKIIKLENELTERINECKSLVTENKTLVKISREQVLAGGGS
jgi:hypothetical protein